MNSRTVILHGPVLGLATVLTLTGYSIYSNAKSEVLISISQVSKLRYGEAKSWPSVM